MIGDNRHKRAAAKRRQALAAALAPRLAAGQPLPSMAVLAHVLRVSPHVAWHDRRAALRMARPAAAAPPLPPPGPPQSAAEAPPPPGRPA